MTCASQRTQSLGEEVESGAALHSTWPDRCVRYAAHTYIGRVLWSARAAGIHFTKGQRGSWVGKASLERTNGAQRRRSELSDLLNLVLSFQWVRGNRFKLVLYVCMGGGREWDGLTSRLSLAGCRGRDSRCVASLARRSDPCGWSTRDWLGDWGNNNV